MTSHLLQNDGAKFSLSPNSGVKEEKSARKQKQYDALVGDFNGNLDRIKAEGNYKYVQQLLSSMHIDEDDEDVDVQDEL